VLYRARIFPGVGTFRTLAATPRLEMLFAVASGWERAEGRKGASKIPFFLASSYRGYCKSGHTRIT